MVSVGKKLRSAFGSRGLVFAETPLLSAVLLAQPVVAQSQNATASNICNNRLVTAMDNLMLFLQAIGPVVGALVAMVAMLVLATTQNPQKKKKWMKTRNDAIKYGVGILFVGAIVQILVSLTGSEIASCVGVLN
ncbi:MAG: hypothetical protein SV760_10110 [Halobacteria archaeon]|nr:hypothetical protein [Halobacteria archaeon]